MAAGDLTASTPCLGIRSGAFFDGIDDKIDTGSDWLPLGDITLSAWINPNGTDVTSAGRILDNGSLFVYFIKAEMKMGVLSSNKTLAVSDINSIELNKWQHLVVTRKSDGATKIYINGVDKSVTVSSETPIVGTSNVIIGNRNDLGRAWGGLISDLKIYDRVLNSDELKMLYNGLDVKSGKIAEYKLQEDYNDTLGNHNGTNTGSYLTNTTPNKILAQLKGINLKADTDRLIVSMGRADNYLTFGVNRE